MSQSGGVDAQSATRKRKEICFQCRNRKVRCDGLPGGCKNCRVLKFPCSLSTIHDTPQGDGAPLSSNAARQLEKRRVPRACMRCRLRKSKCSGDSPACKSCLRGQYACEYPTEGRRRALDHSSSMSEEASATPDPARCQESQQASGHHAHESSFESQRSLFSSTSANALASHELVREHLDAFFDFVYPISCYGFIHRASILRSWGRKTHNPCLILAMCGLSARYISSSPTAEERSRLWIQDAEQEVMKRLEHPMTSDIEALMLITFYYSITRRFAKMMVSSALTARLAYLWRLNCEDSRIDFLTGERRRRLMWCIYVFDTFYSSGRAEFSVCPKNTVSIQLPCSEESFSQDIAVVTEPLQQKASTQPSPNLGLVSFVIRILDIRNRIQRFIVKVTHHLKSLEACLKRVETFQQELQAFRHSIPSRYLFSERNLFLHAYGPDRTPFVMLEIWFHQCHCDLHRFAIPGFREALPVEEIASLPAEFTAQCRQKCLDSALAVSSIMANVISLGSDMVVTDPSLAMCAFHSARVIAKLWKTRSGSLSADAIVPYLNACHRILERPSTFYPTTRILQRGVLDLISQTKRRAGRAVLDPGVSHPSSRGATPPPSMSASTVQTGNRGAVPHEVFSRYSVIDEIRRLRFPPEESWSTLQRSPPSFPNAIQGNDTNQDSSMSDQLAAETGEQANEPTPLLDYPSVHDSNFDQLEGYFESIDIDPMDGAYDMLMTFGFDPSFDSGHSDMSRDTFLPSDALLGSQAHLV